MLKKACASESVGLKAGWGKLRLKWELGRGSNMFCLSSGASEFTSGPNRGGCLGLNSSPLPDCALAPKPPPGKGLVCLCYRSLWLVGNAPLVISNVDQALRAAMGTWPGVRRIWCWRNPPGKRSLCSCLGLSVGLHPGAGVPLGPHLVSLHPTAFHCLPGC